MPAPSAPNWWSPKAGLWLALTFAAIAVYPYARSAAQLAQEGKAVNVAEVKKQTSQEEMKKEKEEHGHGEEPKKLREIKCLTLAPDGSLWGGGKGGLFRHQEGKWVPVAGYPDTEVKSIHVATGGVILVAGKHGAYRFQNAAWTQIYDDEANTAVLGADGALYVSTKEALKRKRGQGEWEVISDGFPLPETKK